MSIAACDPEAFYPLRSLVQGPFTDLRELLLIERFVRTVVLHDEIVMDPAPLPSHGMEDEDWSEEDKAVGQRSVIISFAPVLTGYDFFADMNRKFEVPEINLSPSLIQSAADHANAGDGNVYFEAHIDYLKRMLGVVEQGGSALLYSDFGQSAMSIAQRYPEQLFSELDQDWERFAKHLQDSGVKLVVPPVLGIVLKRAADRQAIPKVILDLRNEWEEPRAKVWQLLNALRNAPTIREADEIQESLLDASRRFSPVSSNADTNPVRILWEILAAAGAGGAAAAVAGGKFGVGAAVGAIGQVGRSAIPLARNFGPAIFGRGAFDLANRVRRELSQLDVDPLAGLLSPLERNKLGLA